MRSRVAFAILALAASCLGAGAQTGSVKSPTTLNAEVNTLFPDQQNGLITPFDARQTLLDIIASNLNIAPGSGIVIGTTPVTGATSGNCLFANAGVVGNQACGGSGGGIAVGTTTITGGTTGRVLYDNAGILGELTVTGSGSAVLATSPTLTTPAIGAATATTINGVSITSAAGASVNLPAGVSFTLSGSNNLTLTTTGSTNVTLPTSGTLLSSTVTSLPSLVTVGTLTGGGTGAGFTLGLGTSTLTGQVPVANGGTGLASGTSGGVLAFTGSTTLVSSGALTLNAPVIGGGAGAAPTVGSRGGNTTTFATTSGSLTSGDCVSIDANGNFIAAGGPCTTGGGGGTVNSGTAGQLAYYGTSSTVVSGNANHTVSAGAITHGIASSVQGQVKLAGATSGTITITGQAAAGTYEFDLPTTAGTSGQPLLSAGGAGSPMTFGTLGVGAGGTGATTFTANGVLYGNTTSAIQVTAQGGANTVLTANAGAPAWSATPTLGANSGTGGQVTLNGSTSGSVALNVAAAAGSGTNFTLPATNGTNGFPLVTNGSGVTSWAALGLAGGGLGITSGTSGGIPYFSSTSAIASSAALTMNLPVIGGGAGSAPTVGSRSGNTTTFGTTSGSFTSGNCVKSDANGNLVDAGATCGGGGAVLLNTLTASSSATLSDTTSFTSTYSWYTIVFENIEPSNATATTCQIQVHNGSFISTSNYTTTVVANGTATSTQSNTFIPCSGTAGAGTEPATGSFINGSFRVYVPTTANVHWEGQVVFENAAAAQFVVAQSGGYSPSITIDGFQVKFAAGNIMSGKILVYGNP